VLLWWLSLCGVRAKAFWLGLYRRVKRIELLVEPVFRGDAGVDGTADGLIEGAFMIEPLRLTDLLYPLRPKNRGPFHLVPVIAKATLERLS
jgi:hypothetical protein